jgi:hypothetical protein
MEKFSSNSFNSLKSLKTLNNNSSSDLFIFSNIPELKLCSSNSFNQKKSSELSEESTERNSKININSLIKKNLLRKDIYGNKIEKGGSHKVSFKDDIKGNFLVEMTLIDTKQNSIKSRFIKNQTILREAKDKEELFCGGFCNIF